MGHKVLIRLKHSGTATNAYLRHVEDGRWDAKRRSCKGKSEREGYGNWELQE